MPDPHHQLLLALAEVRGERGGSKRRNFPGDKRQCSRCKTAAIVVTSAMCERRGYWCSACRSSAANRHRQKHPDRVRAGIRNHYYKNKERYYEWSRQHRVRHPDRAHARNVLAAAIYSGKIKRGVCEACGANRAQAHHDDYSKPLVVRWFCKEHHEAIHHRPALLAAVRGMGAKENP